MINDDDFHRNFHKQFNQTRKLAIGGFIVSALFGLGITGGLVYVVAHFVAKVW